MADFNDGSIVAAPVGITFPQYLTVDFADSYFYQRLNSDLWLQATASDRNAALIQSTRAIDNLNYLGVKWKPDQLLQFPRWQPPVYESSAQPPFYNGGYYYQNNNPYIPITEPPAVSPGIPQDILMACCENAIVLLSGFDFELEIQGLYNTSDVYAGVRTTYDRNLAVSHLRAGIASSVAWNFIRPWLADTSSFNISRVS